jgi:hypothetical protein
LAFWLGEYDRIAKRLGDDVAGFPGEVAGGIGPSAKRVWRFAAFTPHQQYWNAEAKSASSS